MRFTRKYKYEIVVLHIEINLKKEKHIPEHNSNIIDLVVSQFSLNYHLLSYDSLYKK